MEESGLDPYPLMELLNTPVFVGQFSFSIVIGSLVMLALLVLSALVSGAEVAYFSLNPAQLQEIQNGRSKRQALVNLLLERPKKLLATILIANNFVNVAIVILSTYLTAELFNFGDNWIMGFLIQVVVVTSLILLLGEIMPKVYATQYAVRLAMFMANPLQFLIRLFSPLSRLLVSSTDLISRRLTKSGQNLSMDDLEEALELTTNNNTPDEERKMLKGIIRFGDIEASEIMKSRVDVVAIDTRSRFVELMQTVVDSGYSRIPVYEESFDQVKGILYVKDLLPFLEKTDDFEWLSLLRPAFFVPENKRLNDLLAEFREKKIHMAVVVDEYGGTSGIITLEDILEEIVGEISDEFDVANDQVDYKKVDPYTYVFEGKTSINDFCKILEIDDRVFDEIKGDSESLAGLILELVGLIPQVNERVSYDEFTFKILEADNRRIRKIKVTRKNVSLNESNK